MVINGVPDILLMDFDTNNFVTYEDRLKSIVNISHTITIDYDDTGIIAGRKYLASLTFACFNIFDIGIWLYILTSLIILSILYTIPTKYLINYLKNLWNIFILLFTKNIPQDISLIRISSKITIASWLVLVIAIQTLYASFVLDNMMIPTPYITIDNWDDLYHRFVEEFHYPETHLPEPNTNGKAFTVISIGAEAQKWVKRFYRDVKGCEFNIQANLKIPRGKSEKYLII